ncbi:hypothetical protein [Limosilactobacillus antri]|uniref:hypothetical protein n=1 Tax=Limosilactobacillus antri TaxID=227943 RepID=UPI001F585E43|nr:hypothetical protein [Limosilactobacillus antri]
MDEKDLTFSKIKKKYNQSKMIMKIMLSPSGVRFDGMPKGHSADADAAMMRYEASKEYVEIVDRTIAVFDDTTSTILRKLIDGDSGIGIAQSINYSQDYFYRHLKPMAVANFVDVCPVA